MVEIQEDSLPEKTENENPRKPKGDEFSNPPPGDKECQPIITKTLSFKSNRSMWENIEKEREITDQSRTLEQPKKKASTNLVTAPDLLQDLLERSHGKPSPG